MNYNEEENKNKDSTMLRVIMVFLGTAGIMSFLAISDMGHGYYVILRFVLTVAFFAVLLMNNDEGDFSLTISLVCIVGIVLWQPIIPIEATKEFWYIPNILAGLFLFGMATAINDDLEIAENNNAPSKNYSENRIGRDLDIYVYLSDKDWRDLEFAINNLWDKESVQSLIDRLLANNTERHMTEIENSLMKSVRSDIRTWNYRNKPRL